MPRGRAYRFVDTPTGRSPTTRDSQRTVRSHAASVSHPGRSTRRRTHARELVHGQGILVFDADPIDPRVDRGPQSLPATTQAPRLATAPGRSQSGQASQLLRTNEVLQPYRLFIDYLSGDTFSPLRHLPTYHKPYLPGIINHYIYNLTIPIPELDGNSPVPLFRAAWLPVVFHDPVVFQVVVLFAASHYATFADPSEMDGLFLELLSLKQSALLALIQRVQGEQTAISSPTSSSRRNSRDTLIAAAAKMASYEAIFGSSDAFHLHMSTVTRLLRSQGGPGTLGMDGFLARLLSFIDTNSSYLLGTNLYLLEFGFSNRMPLRQPFHQRRLDELAPQARNTDVVDLERFIGLMNTRGVENNEDPQLY